MPGMYNDINFFDNFDEMQHHANKHGMNAARIGHVAVNAIGSKKKAAVDNAMDSISYDARSYGANCVVLTRIDVMGKSSFFMNIIGVKSYCSVGVHADLYRML